MAYILMSQGFETRVKVWKAEWVNDADTPSSTPGTPTSTKKGQREMGPEGRAWSKVVVTVGHCAQGPTKGSSCNPYHSTGDKSAASAFPLLCLCSRSSPAQNAHCAHLSPQTLLFSHQLRHFLSDQHRLKCFFPTLKFHRAYCMYYSFTLIYSCICSLIF